MWRSQAHRFNKIFYFSQECLSSCQDLIEDALQLNVFGAQDNETKLGAEQPTTPTDLQAVDLSS
jgi:hypothetical protein